MKKVMLVEDEELILQGIRCIIDWEEISMSVVSMAHNGAEALELFQKEPVDILVTDVEMPKMNGLELIKEIRKQNPKTRCIILSGYDEFEYARSALKLDVEEYILKPVNEELLKQALIHAAERLDELDRKKIGSIEDKIVWHRFLERKMDPDEQAKFYQKLPAVGENERICPAIMKMDAASLEKQEGVQTVLMEIQKLPYRIRTVCLSADTLFLLLYMTQENCGSTEEEVFVGLQNHLESNYGVMSFFTLASPVREYERLPECYKIASRLQKYRILEGYGSCITESYIKNRTTPDVVIDETLLRKTILKKDKEGAQHYIEDLFINNLRSEVNVDALYQLALKLTVLLQDIKAEYKLERSRNLQNLSEMIEQIYKADDILGLKSIFLSEITEIITYLHTEDSQYTPVVRQIMAEVQKNYKEDMNLKTLSYKYHMNASYLGKIFQKEVGCSFTQYLSNTKNRIAKDLILNTNKKINDIAKEVGYPDTSYFYRKFKQCYGVSPASLRTIKKYEVI